MTACQDGFRGASSKQNSDLKMDHWIPRNVSRLTVDRPHHLLPQASYGLRRAAIVAVTPNSCCDLRGCAATSRDARWIVALTADQQLPDDARILVGQRNSCQLGWLAPDKLEQPGRGMASSFAHLLDQRGGAGHQDAAQGLVTGTGNHPKPGLAGGRVVLRRQSDPSRKIPAAAERLGIWHFHHRQRGTDRADSRNLGNPPARFMAFMPGQLLGLDLLKLSLQARILLAVFGSCVRRRISASRVPASMSAACCPAVFTGTNRIVGRLIASQIASASAASFLFRFTYGLTYCGGKRTTSCPSFCNSRAQWCAAPQASSPTLVGSSFAKNSRNCRRRSVLRSTGRSAESTPCSTKTLLDVSTP